MKKRFSAFLLAALMVASLLPVMSFAAPVEKTNAEFLAMKDGGKITLTEDLKVTGMVAVTDDLEIIGNGHTLEINNTFFLNADKTLKISDLKINGTHTGYGPVYAMAGTVELTGVEITIPAGGAQHGAVIIYGASSLTMEECKVEANGLHYALWVSANARVEIVDSELKGLSAVTLNSTGNTVNISNSKLTASNPADYNYNYGIIVAEAANNQVSIADSELISVANGDGNQRVYYEWSGSAETGYQDNKFTVTGGKIVLDGANATLRNDEVEKAQFTVTATVQTKNGAEVSAQQKTDFAGTGSVTDYVAPVYGGPVMNWVKCSAAENGVVKSGPLAASEGATITLYPKAAAGYVLDTVEVLDAEGNAVQLNGLKFQVPLGGVTVNATFKLAE